jgi:hypothetical protein
MRQVQFFLFGLFLIWFANTGKLRALWNALQSAPPPASKPLITGIGSLPSMPTGNPLDLNNPRNIWNGDPFGLNG